MEKRTPLTRQAFQPSRTRLLQPSQLFKPTSVSAQPVSQPDNHPQNSSKSEPESKPIPRVPRLPSHSSTKSTHPSSFTNFAASFNPSSSQTAPVFAPFLSKSQVKPPSFPLRSANQPALQSANQSAILKSKNQPALQSATRPTPSSLPKEQLAKPESLPKPDSVPKPAPLKSPTPGTKTTSPRPVVESSPQGHSSNSRNSQHSPVTLHNASSPPIPADVSVQEPAVPFPLSTLPSHVLQTMSQDKRDGFIAGWSAGWDAHAQCMRHRQNDPSTSTRSPVPSNVVPPNQNFSSTPQPQCPTPPRPLPVRLTPSVAPKTLPQSGTEDRPTRRKLPDPYDTEERGKNQVTVGANKRPRTSPPANTNPRPSLSTSIPLANQPGLSSVQILKLPTIGTADAHFVPPLKGQNGNTESRKRVSGLDAYLARGKRGDAQSANTAFLAATTSHPVELQRKKRKRNASGKSPELRRPADPRVRQEPERPIDRRARQESLRPTETRTRQEVSLPIGTTTSQDSMRPVATRTRQSSRRPVESRTRHDPRQSAETRIRQESRNPVEIRPRPEPVQATSMNTTTDNTKASSSLKNSQSGIKEHIQMPATASNAGSCERPTAITAKGAMQIPAKKPQPTQTTEHVPVQQNIVEMRNRSFSVPTLRNGSTCDLDIIRNSQEHHEEESGWGSALNAVTTRERLLTRPSDVTAIGKRPEAVSTAAGKPQAVSTRIERGPRRRQLTLRNAETESNSEVNRLAERERDDITVQAYAERFGLVIVERDRENGKVEWVACKFCPVFGCRTRDPDYIMAHRAPFYLQKFVNHLEKDHCVKWKEYKQSNAEEKGQFFSGKALPAKAFHDRVAELKRSQDGMARRAATPRITAEEENARIDKAVENLEKRPIVQTETTVTLDLTDESWIGRDRFRDRCRDKSVLICQRQAPTVKIDKLPSLERISKCFKELEVDSSIAGFILHGIVKDSTEEEWADSDRGFTDTIVLNGDEMRPTTLIFSSMDEAIALRVAFTLRYLHAGMTGSISMALLRDSPEIQAGVPTSDDAVQDVLGHRNALMALGIYILTHALAADWRNWALGLTTRSCRYVTGGAVEVLISMQDDDGELRKTHLITVQNVTGAGAAVVEVLDVILPSWKERLLGVHSGICTQTQEYEKRIETAILVHLQKEAGRELVLVEHDVAREEKPIFPWVLSKMCESKFEELLLSIEIPLRIVLGSARLKAAKAQRGSLFTRVLSGGSEREAFREAWNVAGEGAAEIFVVAEGLRSIWVCDCDEDEETVPWGQRRGQGTVVDSDAERVLWGRGLVRLWKWCGKVVQDLGMETP